MMTSFFRTAQQAKRLFVQLDHHVVVAADNQQGWRLDGLQVRIG